MAVIRNPSQKRPCPCVLDVSSEWGIRRLRQLFQFGERSHHRTPWPRPPTSVLGRPCNSIVPLPARAFLRRAERPFYRHQIVGSSFELPVQRGFGSPANHAPQFRSPEQILARNPHCHLKHRYSPNIPRPRLSTKHAAPLNIGLGSIDETVWQRQRVL